MENFPLRTVESLIHMIPEYEATKTWNFCSGDYARDVDENIFRYYIWKDTKSSDAPGHNKSSSLIVAYQPPYILAPRDFEQFVQTKSVSVFITALSLHFHDIFQIPNFNEMAATNQERLSSSQKVWAKVRV